MNADDEKNIISGVGGNEIQTEEQTSSLMEFLENLGVAVGLLKKADEVFPEWVEEKYQQRSDRFYLRESKTLVFMLQDKQFVFSIPEKNELIDEIIKDIVRLQKELHQQQINVAGSENFQRKVHKEASSQGMPVKGSKLIDKPDKQQAGKKKQKAKVPRKPRKKGAGLLSSVFGLADDDYLLEDDTYYIRSEYENEFIRAIQIMSESDGELKGFKVLKQSPKVAELLAKVLKEVYGVNAIKLGDNKQMSAAFKSLVWIATQLKEVNIADYVPTPNDQKKLESKRSSLTSSMVDGALAEAMRVGVAFAVTGEATDAIKQLVSEANLRASQIKGEYENNYKQLGERLASHQQDVAMKFSELAQDLKGVKLVDTLDHAIVESIMMSQTHEDGTERWEMKPKIEWPKKGDILGDDPPIHVNPITGTAYVQENVVHEKNALFARVAILNPTLQQTMGIEQEVKQLKISIPSAKRSVPAIDSQGRAITQTQTKKRGGPSLGGSS